MHRLRVRLRCLTSIYDLIADTPGHSRTGRTELATARDVSARDQITNSCLVPSCPALSAFTVVRLSSAPEADSRAQSCPRVRLRCVTRAASSRKFLKNPKKTAWSGCVPGSVRYQVVDAWPNSGRGSGATKRSPDPFNPPNPRSPERGSPPGGVRATGRSLLCYQKFGRRSRVGRARVSASRFPIVRL